jgi:DNA polymerase III subunit epsilon
MDFVTIDVETANADFASICQVGLARYRDGRLVDTWVSLIDPDDYFDGINVSIHAIDEAAVVGAPLWPAAFEMFSPWLDGAIVASHTPFDRVAMTRACKKHAIQGVTCQWIDTARVVRRVWPQFSAAGYGLANVAKFLGLEFDHHDAGEDARTAGEILLRAISESGFNLEQWLTRSNQLVGPFAIAKTSADVNPNGALFGDVLVFTGALSMLRREAAEAAAQAGCEVNEGVTRKTTLLVVGDQDIRALNGHQKSGKHRKAEELIAKGQSLRIIGESDFQSLVDSVVVLPLAN